MSYGVAAALQAAVYQRLAGDTALAALVGGAIYDAVPPGDGKPDTFVQFGPEDVRDASDATGQGAEHRVTISVVSGEAGFQAAKQVAGAVADALVGAELVLARGRLVGIGFLRAQARRTAHGRGRRINLVFRMRVEE